MELGSIKVNSSHPPCDLRLPKAAMDPFYVGIPRDCEPWTAQEDALLGSDTDKAVAVKLGRSSASINCRRAKLGIAAFRTSRKAKQPTAHSTDPSSHPPGFVRVKL